MKEKTNDSSHNLTVESHWSGQFDNRDVVPHCVGVPILVDCELCAGEADLRGLIFTYIMSAQDHLH